MPKKHPTDFEYLANNPDYVPDPEIEEFMELEISHSPKESVDEEQPPCFVRNAVSNKLLELSDSVRGVVFRLTV